MLKNLLIPQPYYCKIYRTNISSEKNSQAKQIQTSNTWIDSAWSASRDCQSNPLIIHMIPI